MDTDTTQIKFSRRGPRGGSGRGHGLRRSGGATALALAAAVVLAACQSERDPPSPGADEAWLEVRNDSATQIVEVNLTFSPAADWGVNQLGSQTLLPGKAFQLRAIPCPEAYDMRVVNDAGGETTRSAVDLPCGETEDWRVTDFP